MTRMKFTILALGCSTLTASADIIATLDSVSPKRDVKWSLGGSGFAATQAGVFNWTRTGGTLSEPAGPAFTAFCIELTQNVSVGGSYTYDGASLATAPVPGGPYSPMGASLASKIARIHNVWMNDASGDTAATKAAGAQAAIWETIFDTNDDLTTGTFHLDGSDAPSAAVSVKANIYLVDQISAAGFPGLFALTSGSNQDMVVVPTSASAALLGLGGLAAFRRRR